MESALPPTTDSRADDPSAGRMVGREHRLPVRVYYEDTDFTGLVYHANYLRYFERGRSDFLRLIGADHATGLEQSDPAAFTIARMEVDYLRPARIDEALVVITTYEKLKGARLDALQRIERDGVVLARAAVFAACIDLQGRPRRPHAHLVDSVRPFLPATDASVATASSG